MIKTKMKLPRWNSPELTIFIVISGLLVTFWVVTAVFLLMGLAFGKSLIQDGTDKRYQDQFEYHSHYSEENTDTEEPADEEKEYSEFSDKSFQYPALVIADKNTGEHITQLVTAHNIYTYSLQSVLDSSLLYQDKLIFPHKKTVYSYDISDSSLTELISEEQFISLYSSCNIDFPHTDINVEIADDKLYAWPTVMDKRSDEEPCKISLLYIDLDSAGSSPQSIYLEELRGDLVNGNGISSFKKLGDKIFVEIGDLGGQDRGYGCGSPQSHYWYASIYSIDAETKKAQLVSRYENPASDFGQEDTVLDLRSYTTFETMGIHEDKGVAYEYISEFGYYCSYGCRYNGEEGTFSRIFLGLKRKNLDTGRTEQLRKWSRSDYVYSLDINIDLGLIYYTVEDKYILLGLDGTRLRDVPSAIDGCDLFPTNYPLSSEFAKKYAFSCSKYSEDGNEANHYGFDLHTGKLTKINRPQSKENAEIVVAIDRVNKILETKNSDIEIKLIWQKESQEQADILID